MGRVQANLLLTLAAIIWGSAFVVQQIGTGNLGTISFTGARFLLGALVVLPFALRQFRRVEREERPFQRRDWVGLTVTGLVLCIAAVLQQHGILRTSVANAGFLTAVYVPLVPIIGRLFLQRRVHWSVWPASCGCLAGTYIMSGAQGLNFRLGDLWVISSTLFWAVHVILVGIMASRTRAPLVVAVSQFLVCGLTGLVVGGLVEQPVMADFLGAFYGICYVGVFSVGMAFTLQVVGQRFTPAADAAIILSSETVFAALAGFIFLDERLAAVRIAGAGLILCCILAVELLPTLGKSRPLS